MTVTPKSTRAALPQFPTPHWALWRAGDWVGEGAGQDRVKNQARGAELSRAKMEKCPVRWVEVIPAAVPPRWQFVQPHRVPLRVQVPGRRRRGAGVRAQLLLPSRRHEPDSVSSRGPLPAARHVRARGLPPWHPPGPQQPQRSPHTPTLWTPRARLEQISEAILLTLA